MTQEEIIQQLRLELSQTKAVLRKLICWLHAELGTESAKELLRDLGEPL